MSLQLGSQAPNFTQKSSLGDIHFYEYIEDSWCILFFIQRFYTCMYNKLGEQWPNTYRIAKRNVKVLALSVDGVESHKIGLKTSTRHKKRPYPIPSLPMKTERFLLCTICSIQKLAVH